MKRCIIVQGPTHSNSIAQIRECWKGHDIIYSTWQGNEHLYMDNEMVIHSKLPLHTGVNNLNYQKISTVYGLQVAKQLGYERALKWRSDMWTNNADELLNKFTDGYNTLAWIDTKPGYLTDYWMEDTIDNLLHLWDIEPNGAFPEAVLTKRIEELGWKNRVNLLIEHLTPNLDIFWNSKYGAYWQHVIKNDKIYNQKWI